MPVRAGRDGILYVLGYSDGLPIIEKSLISHSWRIQLLLWGGTMWGIILIITMKYIFYLLK